MTTAPAIITAISNIQKNIEVARLGEHPNRAGTHFRAEDVIKAVRDEMVEHGVVVRSTILKSNHDHETVDTKVGGATKSRYQTTATADIRFTFVSTEDGSEWPVDVSAEGSDIGADSAFRKVYTNATKTAFLLAFSISESAFDSDESAPREDITKPAVSTADIEGQATVAELTAEVGGLIEVGTADAAQVGKVGQRLSDEILGAGKRPSIWKKDARVLEALVKALKAGEAE